MPNFKENNSPAMRKSAYKMKGNPMQRNFGIPLKNRPGDHEHTDEAGTEHPVDISKGQEGKLTKSTPVDPKTNKSMEENQENTDYFSGTTPTDSTSFYNELIELRNKAKKP